MSGRGAAGGEPGPIPELGDQAGVATAHNLGGGDVGRLRAGRERCTGELASGGDGDNRHRRLLEG